MAKLGKVVMDGEDALAAALDEIGDEAQPGPLARAIRTRMNMSLKDVADRIGDGTHFTTVAKLERGKMQFTYEWAREFARALGVPANAFYMPYDIRNGPKKVPAYTSVVDIINREFEAPSHFEACMSKQANLVALTFSGAPDIVSELVMHTAIIDPDKTRLHDGGVYILKTPDHEDGLVAVYRSRSGPPRFAPWPNVSPEIRMAEDDEIHVVGTVIEIQRRLSSRNS